MTLRSSIACLALLLMALPAQASPSEKPKPSASSTATDSVRINGKSSLDPAREEATSSASKPSEPVIKPAVPLGIKPSDLESLKGVALIGLASMAPAALLMFTSFVRIHIVLILIRQALGLQQIPGNQVLAALALLLSLIVMKPVGESVYARAIEPYSAGRATPAEAWEAGSRPIKEFMIDQIQRTHHSRYLWELHDLAEPGQPDPSVPDEMPLRVVAPAFLLSELTTALMIGFMIYLPFLVIDLVVSAVLSAMGLFMLPPSQVAMPLKLILFVLADGWLLVTTALLRTFNG